MKLLTKEIQERAEKQYEKNSDMDTQDVVAKFFNPVGSWTWYLMNKDPKSDYCWGIVDGFALEVGSFDVNELQEIKLQFGLGIERDTSFTPTNAGKLYKSLVAKKERK